MYHAHMQRQTCGGQDHLTSFVVSLFVPAFSVSECFFGNEDGEKNGAMHFREGGSKQVQTCLEALVMFMTEVRRGKFPTWFIGWATQTHMH